MMSKILPKWEDVTREERYFTATLFQELLIDVAPFWSRLRPLLGIVEYVNVIDIGYEICLFRDLAHSKYIEPRPGFEKQTFDIVLTLSDGSLVLIEAKAHQVFSRKQLNSIKDAGKYLVDKSVIEKIYYAGIHSSEYTPKNVQREYPEFALMHWKELALDYTNIRKKLTRADKIYGD